MSPPDNNGPLRDSGERRDSRNLSSHCCVVTPSPPPRRLIRDRPQRIRRRVTSARGTRVDNRSSTCYKHYDWLSVYTSSRLTNRFYVISCMRCKYFEMILEYNLCNSACMLSYIYCLQKYNSLNITIDSTQCWVLISQNINITNVVQQRSKVLADNFPVQTETRLLYKLNNTEVIISVIYIITYISEHTYISASIFKSCKPNYS